MDSLTSGFRNSNFSPLSGGKKPDKSDAGNKNQQTSGAIPKQLKQDSAYLFCASAGTNTSKEATDDLIDKRFVSRSRINSDDEHTLIRHIVDQTKGNGDLSLLTFLWTIIEMSPEILPTSEVPPLASGGAEPRDHQPSPPAKVELNPVDRESTKGIFNRLASALLKEVSVDQLMQKISDLQTQIDSLEKDLRTSATDLEHASRKLERLTEKYVPLSPEEYKERRTECHKEFSLLTCQIPSISNNFSKLTRLLSQLHKQQAAIVMVLSLR